MLRILPPLLIEGNYKASGWKPLLLMYMQNEQLEILGTLAGGVAHDLNNILTSVLGHISLLREAIATSNNDAQQDSLNSIEDGTKKAASVIRQILSFTRGGSDTEDKTIKLNQVLTDCLSLLNVAVPKNISIELLNPSDDIYIFANEGKISQLVLNLAINARDALDKGGQIKIKLDLVDIKNWDIPEGLYGRITVSDNGVGISQDVLQNIWVPFFTTKIERGTGLGLYNVKSIVESYKGKVTVDSQEGQGTTFTVFLPVITDAAANSIVKKEVSPVKIKQGDGKKILVVEDEEIVRTVLQKSLEHLGYSTDIARDGFEAITLFQENPKNYSLVILDMMMPKMSGDELFYKLREIDNSIPVLIASGYSSEGRAQALVKDGACGFIQKPFGIEELAETIQKIM